MSLLNQAIDLLSSNLSDTNVNSDQIGSALLGLLPTQNGDIDFAQLITQFTQGNFGDLITSFLGDGANMNMVASQVISIFGEDNIMNFASKIGIDSETASGLLSNIIPQLIDKNSQGGNPTQLVSNIIGSLFS